MFVESEPGTYELTEDTVGTRFAYVTVRTFYNAGDPDDLAKAHAAQDQIGVSGGGDGPFEAPNWYLAKNDLGRNSFNDASAKPNEDGSFTIHFGGDPRSVNHLPITEGWNYAIRMYQPRKEILDGTWTFPKIEPVK